MQIPYPLGVSLGWFHFLSELLWGKRNFRLFAVSKESYALKYVPDAWGEWRVVTPSVCGLSSRNK